MFKYIEEMGRERSLYVKKFLDILFNNISDTFEHNIAWVFYRTSSWFQAPSNIRVVDALMTVELKKMIEYYALMSMLCQDPNEYQKTLKTIINDVTFTMYKKLSDDMGEDKIKEYTDKFEGFEFVKKPERYIGIKYRMIVTKWAGKYISIYDKLNYIQHNSLLPSAQSNSIRGELFDSAKDLMIEFSSLIFKKYIMSKKDAEEANSLLKRVMENM